MKIVIEADIVPGNELGAALVVRNYLTRALYAMAFAGTTAITITDETDSANPHLLYELPRPDVTKR